MRFRQRDPLLDQRAVGRRPVRRDLGDRSGPVPGEPRRRLVTGRDPSGQHDFEGSLTERQHRQLVAGICQVVVDQAVEPVDVPVELVLLGHQLRAESLVRRPRRIQGGPGRRPRVDHGARLVPGPGSRQVVEPAPALGRQTTRQREVLQRRPGELVGVPPRFSTRGVTGVHPGAPTLSFVVAVLLEPEAGGGGVEDGEQGEVIVLGGALRQLDHRRRLLEDLAAPVEHEMVVRGHKSKRNRQRRPKPLREKHRVLKPLQPPLDLGLAIRDPIAQQDPKWPQQTAHTWI